MFKILSKTEVHNSNNKNFVNYKVIIMMMLHVYFVKIVF